MGMYQEALAIEQELVKDRRYLHQNPEIGLDLPITAKYIEDRLKEMGYEPKRIGECGIEAGRPEDGYFYPQHHPKAIFLEETLPIGTATYAHVAMEWLKK